MKKTVTLAELERALRRKPKKEGQKAPRQAEDDGQKAPRPPRAEESAVKRRAPRKAAKKRSKKRGKRHTGSAMSQAERKAWAKEMQLARKRARR